MCLSLWKQFIIIPLSTTCLGKRHADCKLVITNVGHNATARSDIDNHHTFPKLLDVSQNAVFAFMYTTFFVHENGSKP